MIKHFKIWSCSRNYLKEYYNNDIKKCIAEHDGIIWEDKSQNVLPKTVDEHYKKLLEHFKINKDYVVYYILEMEVA